MINMNKKDKFLLITESCLNEMYKKSSPSISWKKYKKLYENTNISGYTKYYLPEKKCKRIWNKYKKYCPKLYRSDFNMMIMDYAPTSNPRL